MRPRTVGGWITIALLLSITSVYAQNCDHPRGADVQRCQSIVRQQSYAAALAQCDWKKGEVTQWLQKQAARVAELEKKLDALDEDWRDQEKTP